MIEVQDLSHRYRGANEVTALSGVSLRVQTGELVVIRGPSGSGKSTLLMVLGGLLRPSAGEVHVAGEPLTRLDSRARDAFRRDHVGFVFQLFHLVPYLTAIQNTLLGPGPRRRDAASDLMISLGLGDRLNHRPGELSVGECQRTALARALLPRPDLVLADEPTGTLDAQSADEVCRILADYRKGGGTVVVVTHGEVASRYADRVLHLEGGVLSEE